MPQGSREPPEVQVAQVLLALQDLPGHRERQAVQVFQVRLVLQVNQEQPVLKGSPDYKDRRETLAHLELLEVQEQPGRQELLEQQDKAVLSV